MVASYSNLNGGVAIKTRPTFKPVLRAICVFGFVMLIISGVTFAALQSQQVVLAGNTITSASADLKISLNNVDYGSSFTGFNFTDVVPGGPAVPAAGYSFYLKNSGSTLSTVKVAVGTTPTNLSSVDLSKVNVVFTRVPGGTSQSFTLSSLMSAYLTGGLALTDPLANSSTSQYKVQVSMTTDAFSGPSASLSNIDFIFTGLAQ